MNKRILLFSVLFSFLLFFSFVVHSVYSQENTITPTQTNADTTSRIYKKNQHWVCLASAKCAYDGNASLPTAFGCQQPSAQNDMREKARVTSSTSTDPNFKSVPNADTYILECVASGSEKAADGGICTTADSAKDMMIFGTDNYTTLKNNRGYKFYEEVYSKAGPKEFAPNPVKSDAGGSIPEIEWESHTQGVYQRKFLAYNETETTNPLPQPTIVNGKPQYTETQQQGMFRLSELQNILSDNSDNCVYNAWDPYGRVFDSKTLEPIPGARVELFKKRDNGQFTTYLRSESPGGSVTNPQITSEDGVYNFVVPDGTYKLVVSAPGYSFPAAGSLPSSTSSIYTHIYPSETGEEIIQKGSLEHRDIPLTATTATGSYPVKLLENFYDLNKATGEIVINGRASHPFAKVSAYSTIIDQSSPTGRQGKLLQTLNADKEGFFELRINQSDFKPGESFGTIQLEKKNLISEKSSTKFFSFIFDRLAKLAGVVFAQENTTTIQFSPILNYVEGYAYDTAGKVLANTTVAVYLNFSNKPYYQTLTDSSGYYKIPSVNLPSMPYKIRYISNGSVISEINTTAFIAQNIKFLTSKNVNLYNYKDPNGNVASTKGPSGFQFGGSKIGNTNATATPQVQASTQNSMMLVVVILILLIVAAAAIIIVYIRRRQTPQVPPQS